MRTAFVNRICILSWATSGILFIQGIRRQSVEEPPIKGVGAPFNSSPLKAIQWGEGEAIKNTWSSVSCPVSRLRFHPSEYSVSVVVVWVANNINRKSNRGSLQFVDINQMLVFVSDGERRPVNNINIIAIPQWTTRRRLALHKGDAIPHLCCCI